MAFDAFDHAVWGAPDSVFFEGAAHVSAVDLLGLFEARLACGVVLADHDDALL